MQTIMSSTRPPARACIDCANVRTRYGEADRRIYYCGHPHVREHHIVEGPHAPLAASVRTRGPCGPEAILFEQSVPAPAWPGYLFFGTGIFGWMAWVVYNGF